MDLLEDYKGMRQVELVDVVVDLPSVHPTVVLRERDEPWRELWFPVGQAEGVALAFAWRQVASPRPLTHELFTDVLGRLGARLEVVRITRQEGSTYLGELVLVKDGIREVVPCRPSDGLTLALRQPLAVPVVVAQELLGVDEQGAGPAGSSGSRGGGGLGGEAHEHADEDVVGDQRRPAVGDEGQSDAGQGQQAGNAGHDDEGL
jgi:bifunctional DNase/RNase